MELTVRREVLTPLSVTGRLFIDGHYECYTLEDTIRPDGEKVYGRTAIPAGRYRVVITQSPHFKRRLPLLLDVPNFEGVRIHSGNRAEDTEGCILVGCDRAPDQVFRSRIAAERLIAKIDEALEHGDEVWLSIENPPKKEKRA